MDIDMSLNLKGNVTRGKSAMVYRSETCAMSAKADIIISVDRDGNAVMDMRNQIRSIELRERMGFELVTEVIKGRNRLWRLVHVVQNQHSDLTG